MAPVRYSDNMMIMFILLGAAAVLELVAHPVGTRSVILRSVLATMSIFIGLAAAIGLFIYAPNLFSGLLGVLSIYRAFSIARVVKRRMHEAYLRKATRRSTLSLLLFQVIVVIAWRTHDQWPVTGRVTWTAVAIAQAVVALLLLLSLLRTLRRTAWPTVAKSYSDADLPSITVAIPARNETEDLQQCLQSLIASDYPKLEIIVLDDCSQTKRTPEIIREFAHDGVRFVQGEEPSESWLPKNQAYARLAEEASGAYIIFCGVDIRFAPDSLRLLITALLERNKKMISILPERQQEAYGNFSLIQAMRYWWELVPPRRQFRRPPVLSSCWVIDSKELASAGGFAAVKRAIVPEAHFAKRLIAGEGYAFLRSGQLLGIESTKRVEDQRQTAIRMRYPQMHRRPGQVAIVSLLEATFLIMPFVLSIGGSWMPVGPTAHMAAIVASLLLVATYQISARSTRVNNWWFGLVAEPFAVLTDILLLQYSMWRYEFSDVDWKGRNVCVPVMYVATKLE